MKRLAEAISTAFWGIAALSALALTGMFWLLFIYMILSGTGPS